MFRGLSTGQLDAKGRITVPAQYRTVIVEEANSSMVVTIDTEQRCLLLYPFPVWQVIEEKLEMLPSFQPAARRIQRLLIGHATELELDKHGRVLLPSLLRDYAGLDQTVMLVGQGRKIEIWSEPLWEEAREGWLAEQMGDNYGVPPELSSISL